MKKKINWEVLSTLFVGLMSALIAWEANKIGDLQAQIAIATSLPNIQIDERNVPDEDSEQKSASKIEISNLEGRLNNFDSSIVTVIDYSYSQPGKKYYHVTIPLNMYYSDEAISGVNTGIIESRHSANNFLKLRKLRNDIRYKSSSDDAIMVLGPIESYIKISYKDLLNKSTIL